jgi:aldehyde:ferredoxin oxidoreductase
MIDPVAKTYGRFLTLDLATSESVEIQLEAEEVRRFLGGGGIGAKLFVDHGDDDALVIANGLLTGLPVTTACKTSFLFRSPLTGIFGESSVGGKWGAELAKAGVDGLILTGRSPRPVVVYIHDGQAELLDADGLWGLDTFAAHDALAERLPTGARIGVIGPAGEGRVRFASVMFEGEFPRAAGRTGIGRRFGEMNLKGIAVKGTAAPVPANQAALRDVVRRLNRQVRERAAGLVAFGTAGGVPKRERSGDLPVRNFSQGAWANAENISGQTYAERMTPRSHACAMCPIACAKRVTLGSGHVAAQPEYETAGSLGSNLVLDDPEGLAQLNETCNRLGLDTISAGVVVGFLFECVDRGIVPRAAADLGPKTPTWGSAETIQQLLERIASKEGIGAVLAQGVRAAAEAFGNDSERFAIHVKGLELPMHDPRALVSAGATYATGNRGGCHGEGLAYYLEEGMRIDGMGFPEHLDPHDSVGKGALTADMQDLCAVYDGLGLCKFLMAGGIDIDDLARFVLLATGWDLSPRDLLDAGARGYTLKRLYNQGLGLARPDDRLPPRLTSEGHDVGGAAKVLPDLHLMLDDLYRRRGWDQEGRVTRETAMRLGLLPYLPEDECGPDGTE